VALAACAGITEAEQTVPLTRLDRIIANLVGESG